MKISQDSKSCKNSEIDVLEEGAIHLIGKVGSPKRANSMCCSLSRPTILTPGS